MTWLWLWVACAPDLDGDGFRAPEDCDDLDPEIYPGGPEWCNDRDDNCDGEIDGPDSANATLGWIDRDDDGYGGEETLLCHYDPRRVPRGGDCDDTNPDVHPGALERCFTSDDDCDPATRCAPTSNGPFARATLLIETQGSALALAAGDLDGDGAEELAWADGLGGAAVWRRPADGILRAWLYVRAAESDRAELRVADLDGDGADELILEPAAEPFTDELTDSTVIGAWWWEAESGLNHPPNARITAPRLPDSTSAATAVVRRFTDPGAQILAATQREFGASLCAWSADRMTGGVGLPAADGCADVKRSDWAPFPSCDTATGRDCVVLIHDPTSAQELAQAARWPDDFRLDEDLLTSAVTFTHAGVPARMVADARPTDLDGDGFIEHSFVARVTEAGGASPGRVFVASRLGRDARLATDDLPGVRFPAGAPAPWAVAWPDLNRDGVPDLAVLSTLESLVRVSLWYGTLGQTPREFGTEDASFYGNTAQPASAGAMVAIDLDGSGYRDLVFGVASEGFAPGALWTVRGAPP